MKHLKKFNEDNERVYSKDEIDFLSNFSSEDKFKYMFMKHPNAKDSDFYVFLAREIFTESPEGSGSYRKDVEIENLYKVTPDKRGMSAINGMKIRAMHQGDVKMYSIWIEKDMGIDELIEEEGGIVPSWLADTIVKRATKM